MVSRKVSPSSTPLLSTSHGLNPGYCFHSLADACKYSFWRIPFGVSHPNPWLWFQPFPILYPFTTSQTLFHRIFLILVSPYPAPAAALRLSPSPTLPLPLGSLRVAHVCITARSLPVLFRRKKLVSAFPGFVGCTAEWDFTDDTRSPPSVSPPSSPRTACMLPSHPFSPVDR
jgi:hypothetical protein